MSTAATEYRGITFGHHDTPKHRCPTCGHRFYTRVGLENHVSGGDHTLLRRRWAHGRYSNAGLLAMQRRGREIAAENNARRRTCSCGRVSTPAGLALHQSSTGHVGWTETTP